MRRFTAGLARFRFLIASALLVAFFASCKETSGPGDNFTITPESPILFVGETLQLTAVGAPGAVSWSSSNSQVLTVVPETGFVRAVARGEATVSAVSGSTVATVAISVLVPPTLQLSAPMVEFEKLVGGSDPASQTVQVANSGDGAITGIALGAIAYGQGQTGGWLTASISGSGAPATITLSARGNLPRGVYTATIPVTAPNVDNSPQSLAITFRVQAQAEIDVSTNTVPLAGIPGATLQQTVQVTNGGDRPLTGLSTAITYQTGQPTGWLTAQIGATAPATLTLTASLTGLAVGVYNANVRINTNVSGVQPADVAVQLTVSPGPAITLTPNPVNVNAVNGANPANTTVNITNGGGGTLSGLTLGTISYTLGGSPGWLTATLNGTTAPTTITLAIASAALATGSYRATVPVQSTVASNSPLTLTVNLTVGPPPMIAVNPTSLVFSAWGNGPLPPQQIIQITNSGGGTLSGLSGAITYTSGTPGWLTGSFTGGTTAPTDVAMRPVTTDLAAGTYTANVVFSTNIAGVTPRTVTVTYIVQTFSQTLVADFATCSGCHGPGLAPNFSQAANTLWNYLTSNGTWVNTAAPANSTLYRKPAGLTGHGGGSNFGAIPGRILSWITAGAPFR